eukprot:jgi/Bigna1/145650/aug1.102_g20358
MNRSSREGLTSPTRTREHVKKHRAKDEALVNSITVDHYCIPTKTRLTDAMMGEVKCFGLIIARVKVSSGEEGVGYIVLPNNVGGGAIESLITRDLSAAVLGQPVERTERIWNEMDALMKSLGRSGLASRAMSVLDIAVWDAKAKICKKPLWQLLGGQHDLMLPLKDLIRQTERFLSAGFLAIKIKVGRREMKEDVQRVRAVRAFLDNYSFEIGGAWTTSQARKAMIALEKHSVDWVEIPIVTDDVDGYNSLSDLAVPVMYNDEYGSIITKIAAGETVTTEQQMMHLIREGKLNYAQLGVNDIGGITPFMKAAHYAEIHRVPVTSHGVHDLHVHLMAALSNSSYTEVCEYRIDEFITQPLKIANGKAQISTLPGHGIVFQFKVVTAMEKRGGREGFGG